eukprot:IDg13281t1
MNYRLTASMQWILVISAGYAALKLGKRYGRQQADVMNLNYKDATTRKDIAKAITEHNNEIPDVKS